MPIFDFSCEECKGIVEKIQLSSEDAPTCCGVPMRKLPTLPAIIKVEGQYKSRKKWMDNWTPDSPAFSTGSLHGEHY